MSCVHRVSNMLYRICRNWGPADWIMRLVNPSSPGDLSEFSFLMSSASSCLVIASWNRGSTGKMGFSTLWRSTRTTECSDSLWSTASFYGEDLCLRRWCPRVYLKRCQACGSRVRLPSFQIRGQRVVQAECFSFLKTRERVLMNKREFPAPEIRFVSRRCKTWLLRAEKRSSLHLGNKD